MATATATPQTNGVPPLTSSAGSGSQTLGGTQSQALGSTSTPGPSQQAASQPSQPPYASQQQSQPSQQQQQQQQQQHAAPRPRDARTLELLLTAQGVTSFEARVPLLLLDLAYRHTSSVLSDALHLAADPHVSHAGARASAASGAAPVAVGDAAVTANAVQLAIASRLGYQFRRAGGGGGPSKDWMLELARERNRVALPKVAPGEWGVRLPSERFVLSGVGWGLRDVWASIDDDEGEEEEEEEEDGEEAGEAMEGVVVAEEDVGGDGVEGGTAADVFGDELEDETMAEG